MVDRSHKELSDEEISRIAQTYHAWRGEKEAEEYQDIPGFCKSATTEEIAANSFMLTPGRYVGAEEIEDDDEAFAEKMTCLTQRLKAQMEDGYKLDEEIREQLKKVGYGF